MGCCAGCRLVAAVEALDGPFRLITAEVVLHCAARHGDRLVVAVAIDLDPRKNLADAQVVVVDLAGLESVED